MPTLFMTVDAMGGKMQVKEIAIEKIKRTGKTRAGMTTPWTLRLIKNSSRLGEAVLDFFGGSGSTLIACEQMGRKCYMMEIDPKYCNVIVKRWENLTGRKAVRINGA